MTKIQNIVKNTENTLIPFYTRFDRVFVKGKGHYLYDIQEKEYIDFSSGISVVNMGHANKVVKKAVKKQLSKIWHISNLFHIPLQSDLSILLSEHSFVGKSFFCNSGTEANETAIKMARFIGNQKKDKKNKILALKGSFHGRTIAAISATGQEKYRKGFEPLLPGVDFVNYNDLRDLQDKFDDTVCGLFLEAIQGEGGVRPLSAEFVEQAQNLCRKHDALLIFDEVQTGIGRTGTYFGYQHFEVQPDIITLAKALGNGLPVGAVHTTPAVCAQIPTGLHASTFGGNYLAMSAGIAVLKLLDKKLLDHINALSKYIKNLLTELQEKFPKRISDVRIIGLMIGIDLIGIEVGKVILRLMNMGYITLRAGENTLRLLPPFTIGKTEIDMFVYALEQIISV